MKGHSEGALDTQCLITESFEDYHGKRGEYMSSGQVKTLIYNPELFMMKRKGLIKDKDSPAFAIGRAVHALALEGEEAYKAGFLCPQDCEDAKNPKTGRVYGPQTNAYRDWLDTVPKGITVINPDDQALVYKMSSRIKRHRVAREMLSEGVAEGVVRADLHGVPCQIRIDFLNPDLGLIDLKTCNNVFFFTADVKKYLYLIQFAFYRAVYRAATGREAQFYAIAAEKQDGWRVGTWRFTETDLEQAELQVEEALQRFKECTESNKWPNGYEELQTYQNLY